MPKAKTAKTNERRGNLPGFSAEASFESGQSRYHGRVAALASRGGAGLTPQLGLGPIWGVDIGAYLRCKANGGGELVCRFFGGLLF